uniref:T9SS type A sorting domain-containing protein n=1 Tax=candidate division WOR-3 bacterium TaxID=2052148 RepID=A0A7C6ECS2_UNCW3
MSNRLTLILIPLFFINFGLAQFDPVLICSTNVIDATGPNNSHKIAMRQELGDTIHIVFYSNDSVKYVRSTNRGLTWETPRTVVQGIYPAIDIDQRDFRHIVYQVLDSINHTYEVYYYCLDIRSPPRNISETPGNSVNPAIVVDQNNLAHIVWAVNTFGQYRIYYRAYDLMNLSDTFQVSTIGTEAAIHSFPAIGIYQPNNRVYVIWQYYDSAYRTPYQIYSRYREGSLWQEIIPLQGHWYPLREPSLDYSHGEDWFSACWQDRSSGNMEAHFYGGNGGGYNTPGYSSAPVLSTLGTTWSYLFWQDGDSDIFYHLYYFMAGGWYASGTFREAFQIDEPIYYPNCCGCYCIWTQGDSSPYKLYFCDFGYPIGIKEKDQYSQLIKIYPNPTRSLVNLTYIVPTATNVEISLYDLSGKRVKTLVKGLKNSGEHRLTWNGTDNQGRRVPSGVYLCRFKSEKLERIEKVVISHNSKL